MELSDNKTNLGESFDRMKERLLNKPFTVDIDKTDLLGIFGYQTCLHQLHIYLQVVTESNPKKRYIDAVPLIEGIGKASKEIGKLLANIKKPENNDPDDLKNIW